MMPQLLYTVQPSDALGGLEGVALRLYGDAQRWVAIYEASRYLLGDNPSVLRPGQQLIIPDLGEATGAPGSARVYIVQPADTVAGLLEVARRFYGSAERWLEIYAVNSGTIGDDPRALQPGQWLILPP